MEPNGVEELNTLDTLLPKIRNNDHDRGRSPTRSSSPDQTFYREPSTIDDLTRVLTSFSAPTPPTRQLELEPQCCCERRSCDATETWLTVKNKLEDQLRLSAELGQALLKRHEAYVRKQDAFVAESTRNQERAETRIMSLQHSNDQLVAKMAELVRENNLFEKRLAQAQLNLEVSDTSNRTLLKELQETRSAVNRLTAQSARSAGWEIKLGSVTQERDDLKQEHEAERQRSRSTEMKLTAAKERCTELSTEVNRLKVELDGAKLSRVDISEELLQDARARLEMLQSTLGQNVEVSEPEVTRILESLVADNEALKRDNAELQNLLAESREDLKAAREQLDEQQVTTPLCADEAISPRSATIPLHSRKSSVVPNFQSRTHRLYDSVSTLPGPPPAGSSFFPKRTSSPFRSSFGGQSGRQSVGRGLSIDANITPMNSDHLSLQKSATDDKSPGVDSPSPLSEYRPLSPADSNAPTRPTPSFSSLGTQHSSETHSHGTSGDEPCSDAQDETPRTPRDGSASWILSTISGQDTFSGSPEKVKKRKTLMLLTRSRGVQTDWTGSEIGNIGQAFPPNHLAASTSSGPLRSPLSTTFGRSTPQECTSETSSLNFHHSNDNQMPVLPSLLERVSNIHTRISQSDIRTLTNRLKRQNLAGTHNADGPGPSSDVLTHLSRSTITSIVTEVNNLRGHFKFALETDPKIPYTNSGLLEASLVTRKDLRSLLKLLKELLSELTQLRSIINAVTLDPTSASRLKDEAINGTHQAEDTAAAQQDSDAEGPRRKLSRSTSSAMGWIGSAPIISKFFTTAPPAIDVSDADDTVGVFNGNRRQTRGRTSGIRAAPKLAPATSSSTTTVEVEFASTGFRRTTTTEDKIPSTGSGSHLAQGDISQLTTTDDMTLLGSDNAGSGAKMGYTGRQGDTLGSSDSAKRNQNLLGIFAGAPQLDNQKGDGWVMMPSRGKVERRQIRSSGSNSNIGGNLRESVGSNFLRRRALAGFNPNRLSRIVDAVTDLGAANGLEEDETIGGQHGELGAGTMRSLHKRGLSDSSIHSSFMNSGTAAGVNPVHRLLTPASVALSAPSIDVLPTTASSSVTETHVPDHDEGTWSAGISLKDSVLQALSRKVQMFKHGVPGTTSAFGSASALATVEDNQPPAGAGKTMSDDQAPPLEPLSATSSPPRPIPSNGRQRTRTRTRDSSVEGHSQSRPRTSIAENRAYFSSHLGMSASLSGSLREPEVMWNRGGRDLV